MNVDAEAGNNFFQFQCQMSGQRHFYGGCQYRIAKIEAREDRGRWPECVGALGRGQCPAKAMFEKEVAHWATIFYRDRDDCGPGIVKRAELGMPARSEREVAEHHELLRQQGQQPYKPVELTAKQIEALARQRQISEAMSAAVEARSKRSGSKKDAPAPAPKRDVDPFAGIDLGSLINQELEGVAA
ncbi:hypothetical protein [Azospirillum sp. Sh1]|uniref:hypothetical protein n=1 Tax=Azospirillum sp. Sh1 TaxID=2607285 RepID=UPI0011ECD111|nr:hypothetical protein [Azospirillum sp. Sh1]KAA0573403.1 hypothetical protein FZ029_20715 [Azospirillum sp. Sh1]